MAKNSIDRYPAAWSPASVIPPLGSSKVLSPDHPTTPSHQPVQLALDATSKPLAVSVVEAARMIGVGRTFVFGLIKQGKLKTLKFGSRTVVTMASIEALFDEVLP